MTPRRAALPEPSTRVRQNMRELELMQKTLQGQRLQQLRKQIKDVELDLFLAGCAAPRYSVYHDYSFCSNHDYSFWHLGYHLRCRLVRPSPCRTLSPAQTAQDAGDALLQQLRGQLGRLVADDVDRGNGRTLVDDDDAGGDEERDYRFADRNSSAAFTEAQGWPQNTRRTPEQSLEEWYVIVIVIVIVIVSVIVIVIVIVILIERWIQSCRCRRGHN